MRNSISTDVFRLLIVLLEPWRDFGPIATALMEDRRILQFNKSASTSTPVLRCQESMRRVGASRHVESAYAVIHAIKTPPIFPHFPHVVHVARRGPASFHQAKPSQAAQCRSGTLTRLVESKFVGPTAATLLLVASFPDAHLRPPVADICSSCHIGCLEHP
jgi:hypothetical protein